MPIFAAQPSSDRVCILLATTRYRIRDGPEKIPCAIRRHSLPDARRPFPTRPARARQPDRTARAKHRSSANAARQSACSHPSLAGDSVRRRDAKTRPTPCRADEPAVAGGGTASPHASPDTNTRSRSRCPRPSRLLRSRAARMARRQDWRA